MAASPFGGVGLTELIRLIKGPGLLDPGPLAGNPAIVQWFMKQEYTS